MEDIVLYLVVLAVLVKNAAALKRTPSRQTSEFNERSKTPQGTFQYLTKVLYHIDAKLILKSKSICLICNISPTRNFLNVLSLYCGFIQSAFKNKMTLKSV